MPNPTTLTVKVPEGVTAQKARQALKLALPKAELRISRDEATIKVAEWFLWPDCELYGERSTRHPITLNPNVLDPEDAVLVARVLGAVLVTDEDYPFEHARWGKVRLIWGEDPKRVYATTDGWPPQSGWRIHSIPSLGLTR